MAVTESQLKKMVSKVRPRRVRPGARPPLPSAPGPAWPDQSSEPARPTGREPTVALGRLGGPDPEVLVAWFPYPIPGRESGGRRLSTKARAGGRLPPAARPLLLGLSLEQSVGQNSFCFRFYKHKEKVV